MNKFKVGDKVKRCKAWAKNRFKENQEYVVTEVRQMGSCQQIKVSLDNTGRTFFWNAKRFYLSGQEESAIPGPFKKGDKVMRRQGTYQLKSKNFEPNRIYFVESCFRTESGSWRITLKDKYNKQGVLADWGAAYFLNANDYVDPDVLFKQTMKEHTRMLEL